MPEITSDNSRLKYILLFAALLIGIASKLPQLLSHNLLLDGDECIVGLMAKHITEGKQVSVYFYGQKYGFAYFEALAGAISFKLFGYGALQLKAAMLVIWLGAILFFYLSAVRLIGIWPGFLLAIIFIVFPAWAVWSLKARGGYLTSFLFSSGLLYFLIRAKQGFNGAGWFVTGLTIAMIFYAQPFWLAGLLPFILYQFYLNPKRRNLAFMLIGIIGIFAAFHFFATYTSNFWTPKIIALNKNPLQPIQQLGSRLFWHLTGSYYLNNVVKTNLLFVRLTIVPFIILLVLGVSLQVFRLMYYLINRKQAGSFWQVWFKKEQDRDLLINNTLPAKKAWIAGTTNAHLLFFSVIFTLGYCILFNERYYGFRYLLPLSGFVFLWVGLELRLLQKLKLLPGKVIAVFGVLLFITGSTSAYTYKHFNFLETNKLVKPAPGNEEKRIQSLLTYLKNRNITNVFAEGQLLEWFPIFYSKEQVISRAYPPEDRYPLYPKRVNKAFFEGRPTAFIGYFPPHKEVMKRLNDSTAVRRIGFWYYAYLNPTYQELVKLGFYKVQGYPADIKFVEETIRKKKAALSNLKK